MLVRAAGILRALAWVLQAVRNILLVCADVVETLGLNQDVDTVIWIFLIFLLVTRRFSVLGALVALIIFTSPVWYALKSASDKATND